MEARIQPIGNFDVLIVESPIHEDDRGYFLEIFHKNYFDHGVHQSLKFVQDNLSFSRRNVLRGLHYQLRYPQGKLIQVIRGEIFNVCVDLRKYSSQYGMHVHIRLSATQLLWVPPGYANGHLVLSEDAHVIYKLTNYYHPEDEHVLRWNDQQLGIEWPLPKEEPPILSEKDQNGLPLDEIPKYEIPIYPGIDGKRSAK